MWSVLLSRLLMYLRIIKNWLPLCRVCIFMMMAGTGWVGGEMGFAAISHCVPNILPIMMCCILLLFYMVIKYFVISWNMHSICETAKHSFSTLKCLQMNIISKCLCGFVLFLFIYLLSATQVQATIPCGCCTPTKGQALLLPLDFTLRTPLGF